MDEKKTMNVTLFFLFLRYFFVVVSQSLAFHEKYRVIFRTMNLVILLFLSFLSLSLLILFHFKFDSLPPMTHSFWIERKKKKTRLQSSELIPLVISIWQFVFSESNKYVTAHARIAHWPVIMKWNILAYNSFRFIFFFIQIVPVSFSVCVQLDAEFFDARTTTSNEFICE